MSFPEPDSMKNEDDQDILSGSVYSGIFVVTLSTLLFEILLTRIFSVTMHYHFAFMVISVAMFGLTTGSLIVYFYPNFFTRRLTRLHMSIGAILFAVSSMLEKNDVPSGSLTFPTLAKAI